MPFGYLCSLGVTISSQGLQNLVRYQEVSKQFI